ncbi:protein canopy homolog 2 isoform X1 [Polypterus senegalus]|uniref:protein canopy homolog 2 isoform X1 n=1 Tax=Polypterus senegalus TaxID=55291 RepID=UPI0019624B30|nr:protein canopy homolog 2 isoform X1 [Polypterus senegalus]
MSGTCKLVNIRRAFLHGGHVLEVSPRLVWKMGGWIQTLYLCVVIGVLLDGSWAKKSQDMRCGACRALVDEMEWGISQVDTKKMIQTGSFRINPDGSQSVTEMPYARSESHLLELMEVICEKMTEYGEKEDPTSHRKTYERIVSRDGKRMDVSETKLNSEVTASLKFACETIVEQYEDELIEFFSHEAQNVKDKLCSKRTDLCDHALHIPHDEL